MAKKNENPDEIVHLQVAEGSTAVYGGISYGSGATLQVRRGDLDRVDGRYSESTRMRSPTLRRGSRSR